MKDESHGQGPIRWLDQSPVVEWEVVHALFTLYTRLGPRCVPSEEMASRVLSVTILSSSRRKVPSGIFVVVSDFAWRPLRVRLCLTPLRWSRS